MRNWIKKLNHVVFENRKLFVQIYIIQSASHNLPTFWPFCTNFWKLSPWPLWNWIDCHHGYAFGHIHTHLPFLKIWLSHPPDQTLGDHYHCHFPFQGDLTLNPANIKYICKFISDIWWKVKLSTNRFGRTGSKSRTVLKVNRVKCKCKCSRPFIVQTMWKT